MRDEARLNELKIPKKYHPIYNACDTDYESDGNGLFFSDVLEFCWQLKELYPELKLQVWKMVVVAVEAKLFPDSQTYHEISYDFGKYLLRSRRSLAICAHAEFGWMREVKVKKTYQCANCGYEGEL